MPKGNRSHLFHSLPLSVRFLHRCQIIQLGDRHVYVNSRHLAVYDRDSNSQALDCKFHALTITLPSHTPGFMGLDVTGYPCSRGPSRKCPGWVPWLLMHILQWRTKAVPSSTIYTVLPNSDVVLVVCSNRLCIYISLFLPRSVAWCN